MPDGVAKDGSAAVALPTSSSSNDAPPLRAEQDDAEIITAESPSRSSTITADINEKNDLENPRPLSRHSTELGAAIPVPRSKRRGLFGQFTLVAEVENPKTYPRRMKWFITFIVAAAGSIAPMGSSIFFRECPCMLCPIIFL